MALARSATEDRFTTWTNWEGYLKFLDAVGERRVRVTYDRGTLELMSPSSEHERAKTIIGALLECLLEELGFDFIGGGSTTFRREALDRGLEPDECYWIESVSRANVRDRDPERLTEPDVAIEVEVSRSALDRMGIYAALQVREIWRWLPEEGGRLRVYVLTAEGYKEQAMSPTLPRLPLEKLEHYVRLGIRDFQSRAVREFRAWVRDNLLK